MYLGPLSPSDIDNWFNFTSKAEHEAVNDFSEIDDQRKGHIIDDLIRFSTLAEFEKVYCQFRSSSLNKHYEAMKKFAKNFQKNFMKLKHCPDEGIPFTVSTNAFSCSKIRINFNASDINSTNSVTFKTAKDADELKVQRCSNANGCSDKEWVNVCEDSNKRFKSCSYFDSCMYPTSTSSKSKMMSCIDHGLQKNSTYLYRIAYWNKTNALPIYRNFTGSTIYQGLCVETKESDFKNLVDFGSYSSAGLLFIVLFVVVYFNRQKIRDMLEWIQSIGKDKIEEITVRVKRLEDFTEIDWWEKTKRETSAGGEKKFIDQLCVELSLSKELSTIPFPDSLSIEVDGPRTQNVMDENDKEYFFDRYTIFLGELESTMKMLVHRKNIYFGKDIFQKSSDGSDEINGIRDFSLYCSPDNWDGWVKESNWLSFFSTKSQNVTPSFSEGTIVETATIAQDDVITLDIRGNHNNSIPIGKLFVVVAIKEYAKVKGKVKSNSFSLSRGNLGGKCLFLRDSFSDRLRPSTTMLGENTYGNMYSLVQNLVPHFFMRFKAVEGNKEDVTLRLNYVYPEKTEFSKICIRYDNKIFESNSRTTTFRNKAQSTAPRAFVRRNEEKRRVDIIYYHTDDNSRSLQQCHESYKISPKERDIVKVEYRDDGSSVVQTHIEDLEEIWEQNQYYDYDKTIGDHVTETRYFFRPHKSSEAHFLINNGNHAYLKATIIDFGVALKIEWIFEEPNIIAALLSNDCEFCCDTYQKCVCSCCPCCPFYEERFTKFKAPKKIQLHITKELAGKLETLHRSAFVELRRVVKPTSNCWLGIPNCIPCFSFWCCCCCPCENGPVAFYSMKYMHDSGEERDIPMRFREEILKCSVQAMTENGYTFSADVGIDPLPPAPNVEMVPKRPIRKEDVGLVDFQDQIYWLLCSAYEILFRKVPAKFLDFPNQLRYFTISRVVSFICDPVEALKPILEHFSHLLEKKTFNPPPRNPKNLADSSNTILFYADSDDFWSHIDKVEISTGFFASVGLHGVGSRVQLLLDDITNPNQRLLPSTRHRS